MSPFFLCVKYATMLLSFAQTKGMISDEPQKFTTKHLVHRSDSIRGTDYIAAQLRVSSTKIENLR